MLGRLQHLVHLLEVQLGLTLHDLLHDKVSELFGELEATHLFVRAEDVLFLIGGSLDVSEEDLAATDRVLVLHLDEFPDLITRRTVSLVEGENGSNNYVLVLLLGGF